VDYVHGNWCEGLTTYGADYLYKERQSDEEARDYRRTTLQGYIDYVSEGEDISLRDFRQRSDFSTQAIGYGKSLMVFHQVRRLLGDDGFHSALQEFYSEFLFRRASWDDLFDVFSRKAGHDLSDYKAQWLDRTGAPALEIGECKTSGGSSAWDEILRMLRLRRGTSGSWFDTTVVVRQQQEPLYDLLVPVSAGWNGTAAESTVVLHMTDAEATVHMHTAVRPDWIAVDPAFDVLRRIHPGEIPPALSRTLGADSAAVIIASGLAPELETAYEALATSWDEGARLRILREPDMRPGQEPGVPYWLLGFGSLAQDRMAQLPETGPAGDSGWEVNGVHYPAMSGIVVAGGPPADTRDAYAVLIGSTPEQIAALGRKVPHYGKYGFLVFEATTNVAKGTWPVVSSPLRLTLKED
jgi:hypothetical protein